MSATIKVGDKVTWTNRKGTLRTGTVITTSIATDSPGRAPRAIVETEGGPTDALRVPVEIATLTVVTD